MANRMTMKRRKITTLPRSGRESSREATRTLIPLMELIFLRGLKIRIVLKADKFILEKKERKLLTFRIKIFLTL